MVLPRRASAELSLEAHVAIIEARYYEDINAALVEGAAAALGHAGATYERFSVPGALELPAAVAVLAEGMVHYDGFVVLGCVIRGETTHYDIVSTESARGLMDIAVRKKLAIGNGILTVENEAQAWERAGVDAMNKGGGAAEACLAMIALKHKAEPRS